MKDLECSECSLEYRHGENCPNGVADQGVRRMKSAEEVAHAIIKGLNDNGGLFHVPTSHVDFIAQALTAFAEERVKEAAKVKTSEEGTSYCPICEQRARDAEHARAEALEEAAKVAEESDDRELAGNKIRALKGRTV